MAYDEYLGDKIRQILQTKNIPFYAKKMEESSLGLFCRCNGGKWRETDRRHAHSLRKI